MERPPTTRLRVGDWCVDPAATQISRNGETARSKSGRCDFAVPGRDAGEVVSMIDLLSQVWSMSTLVPTRLSGGYVAAAVTGRRPKQPNISRRCRVGISDGGKGGGVDETPPLLAQERARNGYPVLFSALDHVDGGSCAFDRSCVLALSQFRGRTNNPTSAVPAQSESRLQYCRSWI